MEELTPYQQEALRRFSHQKACALFMEMGTGKTRTAVELANLHAERYDIVLWLAPVSTLTNAKDDVAKWGGFRKPALYYGYESIAASDRIYGELRDEVAGKRLFIICDESLYLKNGESKRWRRTNELRHEFGEFVVLLNGTPMSRSEMDIYWQMGLLSHKVFGMDERQFQSIMFRYVKLPDRSAFFARDPKNLPWLKSKIEPYIYECSLELPARLNEDDVHIRFDAETEVEYSKMASDFKAAAKAGELSQDELLGYLTKLKLIAGKNKYKNSKIAKAVQDRRAVVFCEFRDELAEIARHIKNGCFEITGDTPRKERDEQIAMWKNARKPLLIMTGCGAFGLNMQESNEVYFASLPWDYASYNQALHRCYRLGQAKDEVNVHRYITRCGISQMVADCLFKKETLAKYVRSMDWRKMVGIDA